MKDSPSPSGRNEGSTSSAAGAAWAVFLLALAGSFTSLWNGFALDDVMHVVDNHLIRSFGGAWEAFGAPVYPGNLYRPLVIASYALTYCMGELSPLPYHVGNLLLHGANSALIYLLFRRLIGERAGLYAGVIFAVHPVHVEAVANVSGRPELLSALFALLAALCFLKAATRPHPSLSAALILAFLFACALLSKESAATILLLLPAIGWYSLRDAKALWRAAGYVAVLLPVLSAYVLLRQSVLGSEALALSRVAFVDNPLVHMPAPERALNALALLGRYVSLVIFPAILRPDYSYSVIRPLSDGVSASALAGLALTTGLLLLAALGLARRSAAGLMAAWFFAAFAVTCNLFLPIGTIFGERLLYLPGAGIIGLIALAIEGIDGRKLRLVSISALTFGFGVKSLAECMHWRDNLAIHSHAIEVSADSAKARANYAVVLLAAREPLEAISHLRRGLEIDPSFVTLSYLMGVAHLRTGDVTRGRRWLEQALAMEPEHLGALNAYARFLVATGKAREARAWIGRALALRPRDPEALLVDLAVCLALDPPESCVLARDRALEENAGSAELEDLSGQLGEKLKN